MRVPSGASHGPEPCDFDEADLREYVRLPAGVEYSVMPFWYRPSTYIRFRTTSRAGFTAVELSATAFAPPSVGHGLRGEVHDERAGADVHEREGVRVPAPVEDHVAAVVGPAASRGRVRRDDTRGVEAHDGEV